MTKADIHICLIHKAFLIDKCYKCDKDSNTRDIINGYCSCGQNLVDTEITYCTDNNIRYYQEGIYNAYGIELDGIEISRVDFFSLKPKEFIEFITLLHIIIYENFDIIQKSNSEKNSYGDKYIEAYKYLSKILDNWPHSFHIFINELNMHYIQLYQNSNQNLMKSKLYNPIMCVLTGEKYTTRDIENTNILKEELEYIFFSQYLTFLKKLFNTKLVYNKYIPIGLATQFFCLYHFQLKSVFKIYCINDEIYFKLDELINFMENFINENKAIRKIDKKINLSSIDVFANLFYNFGITFNDIFNVIKDNEIEVYINPFYNGINILCMPTNELKKVLLEECIKRLDSKKK